VHESSLARRLVELAVERAREHGARAIRRVDAWVAETEALSKESLRLHFARFARGTTAEAATLDLRVAHVEAKCDACASSYAPDHHVLVCPTCGHVGGQLLGRTGVGIEALEVEEP
jgi:hydrogenase nickel incorporation protein HypA/HybF